MVEVLSLALSAQMSLSTENVARAGEEVNVSFYVMLIHEFVPQVGVGPIWPGPHWEERHHDGPPH